MADNTEEEHIDNPTDNQSENLPDEIMPTADTETITPNQEIENMEVHHHAHDPAAPHHKKSWKSYFWEFLMLFLAVFCGFLAEYQLEHKIERDREGQFIQSIIEDLSNDTATLSNKLRGLDLSIKRLDSLILLFNSRDINQYGSELYFLGRMVTRNGPPVFNDRTIQQMKNSGGFRLIRNTNASAAIIEYYNKIEPLNLFYSYDMDEMKEYKRVIFTVFDVNIINQHISDDDRILRPEGNPPLKSYDRDKIEVLIGHIHYIKSTRMGERKKIKDLLLNAEELIERLKNEYQMK